MECENTFTYGGHNTGLPAWNSDLQFNGISNKRKRSENGTNGNKEDFRPPTRLRASCFLQLHHNKGIFLSEQWKPNGSTLFFPISSQLLVNFEKYDQLSFDEGLFFIGDDSGGCLQKEKGHVIYCWRFDDKEKALYIAMSYLFTDYWAFQEVVNHLGCA